MIDAHGPMSEPAAEKQNGTGAPLDLAPAGPCAEGSSSEATPEQTPEAAHISADPAQLWAAFQDAVLTRIRPEQFETWFRRAALKRVDGDHVVLAVQNSFALSWLETHYREILEESARVLFGDRVQLELTVDAELTVPVDGPARASTPKSEVAPAPQAQTSDRVVPTAAPDERPPTSEIAFPVAAATPGAIQRSSIGGVLADSDFVLNDQYTFDNFVVGPCNRFAHAAAMGASESPGTYNPFFLHGSVGLGKTHLLQSICFSILEGWPDSRILYLSCETFVNHFIHALQDGNLMDFRHKYRNVDVLVVDDVHLLANKERTQEEFFHTFNTLYNAGKLIVLSSDSPPIEIPTLQERLVSRFKWGMVTEVEKPCFETRMAIVMRKGLVRGHEVPNDVAKLIAERIQSNVRELEGAVTRLIGYASLTKQPITVDLARVALRDIFVQRSGKPTMDDIVRVVTDHFQVKLVDLQSKSRTSSIVFPRQVAMHLARRITTLSLGEIGGHFGGRDHSTVLYAIDKIEKLSAKDSSLLELLQTLLASLETPAG